MCIPPGLDPKQTQTQMTSIMFLRLVNGMACFCLKYFRCFHANSFYGNKLVMFLMLVGLFPGSMTLFLWQFPFSIPNPKGSGPGFQRYRLGSFCLLFGGNGANVSQCSPTLAAFLSPKGSIPCLTSVKFPIFRHMQTHTICVNLEKQVDWD